MEITNVSLLGCHAVEDCHLSSDLSLECRNYLFLIIYCIHYRLSLFHIFKQRELGKLALGCSATDNDETERIMEYIHMEDP